MRTASKTSIRVRVSCVSFAISASPGHEVAIVGALRSAGSEGYTVGVSTIEPSYRYIVRAPGVRGGHARVDGTRIGVHDVIGLLQNGEAIDSLIANCFPELTRAQVYECLAYYEDHRGEVDVLVARQMSAGE